MIEVTNVVVVFSLALAALAAFAWFRLSQGPGLQDLDHAGEATRRKTEIASKLLMLAVVSSALAAGLAVGEWFSS